MVLADVNAEMMAELESMGFPHNRAVRALHFSGNSTVEGAINWLEANESDPDLDKELMVAKASSKPSGPKLSPEEAKKRADELVRKAKEKREREEKEAERHRELERIRSGKEMLAAKQKADEADRKRALDLRRLEKEEEARAREKIRLRLEEDRRERRRKLGLPEEPTEEEKAREAAEAEAARKADEERKAKAFVAVRPVSVLDKVRKVLVGMKKAHDDGGAANERFKAALSTLLKYIGNVVANPSEDKFRTIKMTNAAFQARVASVDGSVEVLKLAGFEEGPGGETLVMPAADAAAVETLRAIGPLINDALTNPFFGAL
uniref:UBA domain-containing protein n=1 Tax=Chlamydomonas euryale TaxID=1486919 RepID=A0A7R9VJY6_9CHLO|mmetsp:Transcript_36315/g.107217  ORF Transcript_36315/g.107217 Transcript_36315/m.107217 type:complete len:320 (+) Transcript_36315:311-1270(+)